MTIYNRSWLKDQIGSYLHDSGVADKCDNWIDVAAKRVSQVLECFEMEKTVPGSLSAGDDTSYLPLDSTMKRILSVQSMQRGQWASLASISRQAANQYKFYTGCALYYLVEDRKIYPLPFTAGDYRAQLICEVEIPADDTEVDALTAYPFIFLNAALTEAYDWKQNLELVTRFEGKWYQEAQKVAATYRAERQGEGLAMRAV